MGAYRSLAHSLLVHAHTCAHNDNDNNNRYLIEQKSSTGRLPEPEEIPSGVTHSTCAPHTLHVLAFISFDDTLCFTRAFT